MSVVVRADSGGVVSLGGELDFAAFQEFLAAIDPMLDGKHELVLDLANLRFLDSTGLRAFLIIAGKLGGGIVLRRPTREVRRVIDVSGIEGRTIRIEE